MSIINFGLLFLLDLSLFLDVHEKEVAYDCGDPQQGQPRPNVEDGVFQIELSTTALHCQIANSNLEFRHRPFELWVFEAAHLNFESSNPPL